MTMSGEYPLAARREVIWPKLSDEEVLRSCISGCEELNRLAINSFEAVVAIEIGPVKTRFRGKVDITAVDPGRGYWLSAEGHGGDAGSAKGGASIALIETSGGTLLVYKVDAQVKGTLAQLGRRLVAAAAKQLADGFLKNFAGILNPPHT